jgi:hypothetical protein
MLKKYSIDEILHRLVGKLSFDPNEYKGKIPEGKRQLFVSARLGNFISSCDSTIRDTFGTYHLEPRDSDFLKSIMDEAKAIDRANLEKVGEKLEYLKSTISVYRGNRHPLHFHLLGFKCISEKQLDDEGILRFYTWISDSVHRGERVYQLQFLCPGPADSFINFPIDWENYTKGEIARLYRRIESRKDFDFKRLAHGHASVYLQGH